jgi:hypothetical protein
MIYAYLVLSNLVSEIPPTRPQAVCRCRHYSGYEKTCQPSWTKLRNTFDQSKHSILSVGIYPVTSPPKHSVRFFVWDGWEGAWSEAQEFRGQVGFQARSRRLSAAMNGWAFYPPGPATRISFTFTIALVSCISMRRLLYTLQRLLNPAVNLCLSDRKLGHWPRSRSLGTRNMPSNARFRSLLIFAPSMCALLQNSPSILLSELVHISLSWVHFGASNLAFRTTPASSALEAVYPASPILEQLIALLHCHSLFPVIYCLASSS